MPVSVVVGGQFGSEGKGKVVRKLAELRATSACVRVGGSNAGHCYVNRKGEKVASRHLPSCAELDNVALFLGPGSYIEPQLLLEEAWQVDVATQTLAIDPLASVIEDHHRDRERQQALIERIGSTGSGTGAAVSDRVNRHPETRLARDVDALRPFTRGGPVASQLRQLLDQGRHVLVEGSQGFGLSLLHAEDYPKATSRDTTAASALSEAGLSPRDVDEVILVIRTFPIRVAGDSGHLPNETSWEMIAKWFGHNLEDLMEYTTVTNKVRRVGLFDPEIVKMAIEVNNPDHIVLNHLDYIDPSLTSSIRPSQSVRQYVNVVERLIEREISWFGVGEDAMVSKDVLFSTT